LEKGKLVLHLFLLKIITAIDVQEFKKTLWEFNKMQSIKTSTLRLTGEEKDILQGKKGNTLQKVLKTIVAYGEAIGAEELIDLKGNGHFVITYSIPGIAPSMKMLDELVKNGLKTKTPFTLDPMPPLDYENWFFRPEQIAQLEGMYQDQNKYNKRMIQLGLLNEKACTCTPYLPEVGSIPKKGDILAWSESACAIFANSVLGARTNKNGAIIDLLCGIVGKAPLAGLLTDKGREADCMIGIQTDQLPVPQLLGAVIGTRVLSGVPYITGLDRFFQKMTPEKTRDYLHEMGAACATAGNIALFHVENMTPEAIEFKRDLLIDSVRIQTITQEDLDKSLSSYPVLWKDAASRPTKCFIGCPHLSFEQLTWWSREILKTLDENHQKHVKVQTTLCAAPQVLERYKTEFHDREKLLKAGVRLSSGCAMQAFDNGISDTDTIISNSNKLRAYTHARYIPDPDLSGVIISGMIE
jgi:predicted aconitase